MKEIESGFANLQISSSFLEEFHLDWSRSLKRERTCPLINNYSRLLVSPLRLSGITAYLEVKFWSLFWHRNLTTGKYIVDNRRHCSSEAISPLFHNSFYRYILCKGVKLHMNLGYFVVRFFFLNSGNLICRSTDISMNFRESLGVRDNESRLYSH